MSPKSPRGFWETNSKTLKISRQTKKCLPKVRRGFERHFWIKVCDIPRARSLLEWNLMSKKCKNWLKRLCNINLAKNVSLKFDFKDTVFGFLQFWVGLSLFLSDFAIFFCKLANSASNFRRPLSSRKTKKCLPKVREGFGRQIPKLPKFHDRPKNVSQKPERILGDKFQNP